MHPGFYGWWKHRHGGSDCGPESFGEGRGCGEGERGGPGREHRHGRGRGFGFEFGGEDGGGFGVRRPLRFLAHKLELDESQVAELAVILNELKTERAQAAVDDRRTIASFADALAGEAYDEKKAADAAAARVKSAERLRDAVSAALRKIHTLLAPEQRQRLAYLIRTGVVTI
jgi:Spy/CpxP family protein refolding chaperone